MVPTLQEGGSVPAGATAMSTSSEPTLPATITPTVRSSSTPMNVPTLTATPLVVAEVPSGGGATTSGQESQIAASSVERTIMIGGSVAGVLGIALIGVAVMAYQQTSRRE
jgi:hypothetical protein